MTILILETIVGVALVTLGAIVVFGTFHVLNAVDKMMEEQRKELLGEVDC